MFHSPIFGGCKYTNIFLFINKNTVFQRFDLLITFCAGLPPLSFSTPCHDCSPYVSTIRRVFGEIPACRYRKQGSRAPKQHRRSGFPVFSCPSVEMSTFKEEKISKTDTALQINVLTELHYLVRLANGRHP